MYFVFGFSMPAHEDKTVDWMILLMDKILHDLKDSKLWELLYIPYNG